MTAKDRARQLCHARGKLFSAAWNIVSQHKQKQFFGKHTTCGKLTRWRRFKGSEKMCLSDKIWHETCLWVIVTTIFRRFHSQKKPTESHRNMHRSSVENLMWNQLFLISTIPQTACETLEEGLHEAAARFWSSSSLSITSAVVSAAACGYKSTKLLQAITPSDE